MGSTLPLTNRRLGVDKFYTQLSVGIAPDQVLIGDTLFPVLRGDLSRMLIAKYGVEAWQMIDDAVGDRSMPKRVDIQMGKLSIDIEGHALINPVSDREQQESLKGPAQLDLEKQALYTLKQRMLLRREFLQATLAQNTALYPAGNVITHAAGATRWDNIAAGVNTADPIAELVPFIENTIPQQIGRRPNIGWTSSLVWSKIITNTIVKQRVFGTANPQGTPTKAQIASLMGLEDILVGYAVTRPEPGDETSATTPIWGKSFGVAYVPPVAGTQIPAFGYTAEQRVFGDAAEAVVRIRNEYMGPSGGWDLKRSAFYSPVMTFPTAGTIFTTVVS
ncbi:MAG: hypothetical protein M3167_06345 [Acidobacteriota bacterium]|nr:hypothetical protein [Acidobacteriota bacterium]MDQ6892284.1 hypothetical protein [Acidobacteriota bacterium]